jgi:tetratricopeptide (TPR) repeat protein
MGVALERQGKLEEATEAYTKALSIKPDYAEAYNNMGNALREKGKPKEAIEAYTKALSIKPDFTDAYYNMGNALRKQGKPKEAIEAYTKALAIKPDYANGYNNIGYVLKEQGKLDEAIEAYTKALSVKPNFAEAYNNMGITFNLQGKLDKAREAYKKALSIKPDFAEAYWNKYGVAQNISEAKACVEKCLKADPTAVKVKLTLSALQFYEGDKSEFNALLQSSLKDHPSTRSFIWAFSLPKLPTLHFHRLAVFDHMTDLSKKDRPFYEFGVWRGEAFRYLIKTFKKGYGFDTFDGLPEDWHDEKAGTYTSDGNIPKIKGGKFIVGKFEDTLPSFFAEERPMASIINFDADLYSSTICALNHAKPVIDQHTILIFDEFIINKNWEQDEYKALEEFCANNGYTYEVIAISFFTKQVAVKIIGI